MRSFAPFLCLILDHCRRVQHNVSRGGGESRLRALLCPDQTAGDVDSGLASLGDESRRAMRSAFMSNRRVWEGRWWRWSVATSVGSRAGCRALRRYGIDAPPADSWAPVSPSGTAGGVQRTDLPSSLCGLETADTPPWSSALYHKVQQVSTAEHAMRRNGP